jgi:hypothetical protein
MMAELVLLPTLSVVICSCELSIFEVVRAFMQMFFYGFLSAYGASVLVVALILWKGFGQRLAQPQRCCT